MIVRDASTPLGDDTSHVQVSVSRKISAVMAKRISATSEQVTDKEELKESPRLKPERWSMKNWILFINERAPPLVFLLLAILPTASGLKLSEGFVDYAKLAWGTAAHLILLITLRIMDDVKDYEKDKICHPDCPLPRGFMAYDEVCTVINMLPLLMIALAGGLFWQYDIVVASSYTFCVRSLTLIFTVSRVSYVRCYICMQCMWNSALVKYLSQVH